MEHNVRTFERAVKRLIADVEGAFNLFGPDVSNPVFLRQHFAEIASGNRSKDEAVRRSHWVLRADVLAARMIAPDLRMLRSCIVFGFDDPDARVRGIAWCFAAEQQAKKDITNSIIAEELVNRLAGTATEENLKHYVKCFIDLLQGTVGAFRGREFQRGLEAGYIEAHGGSDAAAIQSTLSAAICFLEHPDSGRRLAALRALVRRGREAAGTAPRIAQMLFSDPNADVRRAAIAAYSAIMAGTCDIQSLRHLADLVLDDDEPMLHRFAAYNGLFQIRGAPFADLPFRRAAREKLDQLRDSSLRADWPIDIDWDLVRRCARPLS